MRWFIGILLEHPVLSLPHDFAVPDRKAGDLP
jgi:hypothetical protein